MTVASSALSRYSASASGEPKRRPGAASGPWWQSTQWASASRRSVLIPCERAAGMDEGKRLALAHCVLCHHGPDAAPGRRFGSAEALALYRLNALDATVKGALEHGLN